MGVNGIRSSLPYLQSSPAWWPADSDQLCGFVLSCSLRIGCGPVSHPDHVGTPSAQGCMLPRLACNLPEACPGPSVGLWQQGGAGKLMLQAGGAGTGSRNLAADTAW